MFRSNLEAVGTERCNLNRLAQLGRIVVTVFQGGESTFSILAENVGACWIDFSEKILRQGPDISASVAQGRQDD